MRLVAPPPVRAAPPLRRLAGWRPLPIVALACKLAAVALWLSPLPSAVAAVVFFAPDPFLFHAIVWPDAQGFCRVRTRFATNAAAVWLTIDDGPDPADTPRLLDLLDQHDARATFFVIGERAARHPDLVAQILRRGHEVAHHTHTHPAWTFWAAGPWRVARELDDGMLALAAAGAAPARFRPPVGLKPLFLGRALALRRLDCIGWSVRSGDGNCRQPAEVARRVMSRIHPGAILLLHEGPAVPAAVRVAGIAALLAALADSGYTCVIPDRAQLR